MEFEAKLREKTAQVERLERDRRWLADREKEQQEERERERTEYAEEKVTCLVSMSAECANNQCDKSKNMKPQFGTSGLG
jgi:hypothetical protein